MLSKGALIWRRASPPRRASPLWRDPTTLVIPLMKNFCVYMDRGLALLGEISPLTTRDLASKRASPGRRARHLGANALFINYFKIQQKELVTDVRMSGPLARASPPVKLSCKMGMKTRPRKRASPPGRAGSLHINTA